jgi:hypothetical protein
MPVRRLLLLALAAGLVALTVAAWLLLPRTAITRENAAKIRPGMTLAEVEAILHGPARDESSGKLVGDVEAEGDANAGERERRIEANTVLLSVMEEMADQMFKLGRLPDGNGNLFWISDRVFVQVVLDENDRVFAVSTIPARRADEGPLERLRRWLGL